MSQPDSSEQVAGFIAAIFEPEDIVEVRRIPSGRSTWHAANELTEEHGVLREENEAGENLFIGINPRRTKGDGTPASACDGEVCGKCDRCVQFGRILTADFDYTSAEDALARIQEAGLPSPSVLVNSGHGIHAHWRLLHPVDSTTWAAAQGGLAGTLRSDPSIKNPSRVIRLPGFLNHKPPPAECRIIQQDGSGRHGLKLFPQRALPVQPPAVTTTAVPTLCTIQRAAAALQQIPPGVEGQRGDDQTYRAACLLTRDYGLDIKTSLPLLQCWNQSCRPPWSDAQLQVKLSNALRYGKAPIGIKAESTMCQLEQRYSSLTFPIAALPHWVQAYSLEAAKAIACPVDYVAVPILCGLGAAIGRSRSIRIKQGWDECPGLWIGIVADSGDAKTPAIAKALAPLRAKRATRIASDTTAEALAVLLSQHPRGVLIDRDELVGLFLAMNEYKKGKGADEQFYLGTFSGTPITVDRKSQKEPIRVDNPCLSIVGGIQPDVLGSRLTPDHFASGFAARFLFSYPERLSSRPFTKDEISADSARKLEELYSNLESLELTADGPIAVALNEQADRDLGAWINAHREEMQPLVGPLRSAWTKLEQYMLRVTLILHLARTCLGDTTSSQVDRESVAAAVQLLAYFKAHAVRVYRLVFKVDSCDERSVGAVVSEPPSELAPITSHLLDRACEWALGRGNLGVRPRDLLNSHIAKSAAHSDLILKKLVEQGRAQWRPPASGQREPRLYINVSQQSAAA